MYLYYLFPYLWTYFPEELQNELLRDIELSESHIMSWRQHVIRCYNQDRGRTSLLDKMKPNEVLILMDWAMKFLPLSFREKQSEWFGQKGLNWHVCVCVFKDNELKPLGTIVTSL